MKSNSGTLKFCLYARKSSESDEKQAMSIKGQLLEMKKLAKRERLNIVAEITESHSAKETGQRPQFNKMIEELNEGKYNGIITWAPDRISRNAGDLGRIVDLMDQGKLLYIQTHSQIFSNNPNEKFLLMILCSQAKLENDNRGINVKRGLRSKCDVGIRPGPAPLGYINKLKNNRITSVELDPERAPQIKEMFQKVADQGWSGRTIKQWLDKNEFKTRSGKKLALSRIYGTLKNPFYYGEFKYGNKWYKGTHEPLVSKYIFDKVQIQLEVLPKQWNKQVFPFKKLIKCNSCGGSVTAEVKYRRLRSGKINTHIYYHCNRIRDYTCNEPYITEIELIQQLVTQMDNIKIDEELLWYKFKDEIERLDHLKKLIGQSTDAQIKVTPHNSSRVDGLSQDNIVMLKDYILHVLQYGTPEERLKILTGIKSRFTLSDRKILLRLK